MPFPELARWGVAGLYAIVLIAAAVSDVRRRRIPNWTVIALLVLFVPWIFVGPAVSFTWALAAFAIALVASLALYLLNVIGAGDSKLFAAVALFAGMKGLGALALATALIGGVIAIGVMLVNPKRVLRGLTAKGRAEQKGIPYGVPIALAALLVMFTPSYGVVHDQALKNLPKSGPLLPEKTVR
jgi:prepilin peptidase CpaA